MDSVVVYTDQCEVTRVVTHDFEEAGLYDVCVEGLLGTMLTDTLRVLGGVGSATVLEVSTRQDFDAAGDAKTLPADVQEKQAAVDALRAQRDELALERDALEASQKWLDGWSDNVAQTPVSQAQGGADAGFLSADYIENVRGFTAFFAEEQTRLLTEGAALDRRLAAVREQLAAAEGELHAAQARAQQRSTVTSAVVALQVAAPGTAAFSLVYRAVGCHWAARYDCRLDAAQRVQLTFYGAVTNGTGETWDGARLTLSTAEPAAAGAPPVLRPALVSFADPAPVPPAHAPVPLPMPRPEPAMFARRAKGRAGPEGLGAAKAKAMGVATAEARRGATSCSFDVARRTTVPSDGEAHRVTVAVVPDIAAALEYHVLPRRQPAAYIKAVCTNPCGFCLLDGPCSVFNESSFVSASAMKYTAAGEPFAFFLGPDPDVAVAYRAPTALADRAGLVFRSNVDSFEGEVRVTNNKDRDVRLVVQDQLPKSDAGDVTVTLVEPALPQTPGVEIGERNLITWTRTLAAGETSVLPIKFTVEYPKDRELIYRW